MARPRGSSEGECAAARGAGRATTNDGGRSHPREAAGPAVEMRKRYARARDADAPHGGTRTGAPKRDVADGLVHRNYLKPGDVPEATFEVDVKNVRARAHCTQHGRCIER